MFKKKQKRKINKKLSLTKQKRKKQSQKIKRFQRQRVTRKIKINWLKIEAILLGFCFVVVFSWILFFSGVLKITNIKINGYSNQKNVIKIVDDIKKEKIFNRISKNNLIIFPNNQLIQAIKENNLIVKNVQIVKKFPNTLLIDIERRKSLFLLAGNQACDLFDEDANKIKTIQCSDNRRDTLLKICEKENQPINLKCVVIINNNSENIFEKAIYKNIFAKSLKIIENLQTTPYYDEKIIFVLPGLVGQEIKTINANESVLLFALDRDLNKQLQIFRLLLKKELNLEDLTQLEYLDLRLDGKVVYKFKEGYKNKQFDVKIKDNY